MLGGLNMSGFEEFGGERSEVQAVLGEVALAFRFVPNDLQMIIRTRKSYPAQE